MELDAGVRGDSQAGSAVDLTGEKCRKLRQAKGWSQATLAIHAAVHKNTIINFEQGRSIRGAMKTRISDALQAAARPTEKAS